MLLTDWLAETWGQTRTVRVLAGGLYDGPLIDRAVLAEIVDPARLATARQLTTNGVFTGGTCRCPGSLTLALYDVDGRVLGGATLHGHGSISWERSRFADDLDIAEPTALALFLSECGVSGLLVSLFTPLVEALGYYEKSTVRQFRPPSAPALLIERQVPPALRDDLLGIAGDSAAELSPERVHTFARRLATGQPDPVDRAVALLNWLGRLPYPTEALWGEGVLVRRLLDMLPESDLVVAAASGDPVVALGAINWAVHQPDDRVVAAAIAPVLRAVLPDDPD